MLMRGQAVFGGWNGCAVSLAPWPIAGHLSFSGLRSKLTAYALQNTLQAEVTDADRQTKDPSGS